MMSDLWRLTVARYGTPVGICQTSQLAPTLLALVTENHILSAVPAHGRPRASRVRKGVIVHRWFADRIPYRSMNG